MISHKHKCIFTRVAKTGSSTLIYKVFPEFGGHRVSTNYRAKVEKCWSHDSNHYPLYITKEITDSEIYESYFKFAFVRNPWDRLLSAYFYTFDRLKNTSANFDRWIRSNLQPKYSMSQFKFTRGCNFIGRFENLEKDFKFICDKIGLHSQQLPHKNKTNHRHYTEYYDDETRQLVAEKYAKDIEYFGYEFGK